MNDSLSFTMTFIVLCHVYTSCDLTDKSARCNQENHKSIKKTTKIYDVNRSKALTFFYRWVTATDNTDEIKKQSNVPWLCIFISVSTVVYVFGYFKLKYKNIVVFHNTFCDCSSPQRNYYRAMRSLEQIFALLPWCLSVCLGRACIVII